MSAGAEAGVGGGGERLGFSPVVLVSSHLSRCHARFALSKCEYEGSLVTWL